VWRDGKIVDLGTLGGNSWARAINSRGDVVGGSEAAPLWSPRHAVLWRGTTLIDLSTPASFQSDAWGINDRGQVVGWANWPPFEVLPTPHPVLWQNGVMVDLGSLGGTFGEARGIDARGRVVGYSITKDGAAHAFLWEDGVMTDLGTLGGRNSQALAITESGLIVGNAELSNGVANAVVWIVK
jgi:probable HAF family extracellular repeat protein